MVLGLTRLLYNYLSLRLFNAQWEEFPAINGILIVRGRGKLKIGRSVKINSSLTSNPVGLTTRCLIYKSAGAEIYIETIQALVIHYSLQSEAFLLAMMC